MYLGEIRKMKCFLWTDWKSETDRCFIANYDSHRREEKQSTRSIDELVLPHIFPVNCKA